MELSILFGQRQNVILESNLGVRESGEEISRDNVGLYGIWGDVSIRELE